jgi:hypothetical protein
MTGEQLKTTAVADHLGCPSYRLTHLIRFRRIPQPTKDTSGDYCWSAEDIARAREALAQIDRRLKKGVPA